MKPHENRATSSEARAGQELQKGGKMSIGVWDMGEKEKSEAQSLKLISLNWDLFPSVFLDLTLGSITQDMGDLRVYSPLI